MFRADASERDTPLKLKVKEKLLPKRIENF